MSVDMDRELLKTLHVHTDDLPFVEFTPGTETRLLQVRPRDRLVVTHIRARPGATSALHRHPSPVYGWTVAGGWGHDHQYLYKPGTYIFETPGVIHQFVNGPTATEAVFVSTGDLELIDPASRELIGVATPRQILDEYIAKCEAAGVIPDVLG